MREGRQGSGFLLEEGTGQVIAVGLGWDHCAEHEWDICGLHRDFGIAPRDEQDENGVFGLERRRIRTVHEGKFGWYEWETQDPDAYASGKRKPRKPKMVQVQGFCLFWDRESVLSHLPERVRFWASEYRKHDLWTAWSDRDLGAFSMGKDSSEKLREIYDAILSGDGVLWRGGGGPFSNAGLYVGIASRISQDALEAMATYDREDYELRRDAIATGVEERLRQAGKKFFALSPRRTENGAIKFFLNPYEQDKNNFGQFTVEELDQWIKDEGPIPMTKEQIEERRRRYSAK